MKNLYFFVFTFTFLILFSTKNFSQNNLKNNPVLLNNLSSLYYSTYYGGNSNETFSTMCLDSTGNIFTAGNTSSSNYPIVNSSSAYHGKTDVTINKFDNKGKLIFSMCIGGQNDEYVQEILCDRSNNIWISGETNSSDFPVTGNAFQSNNNGGTKDGYLMKFDNSGNLLFSTFWGGSNYESFAGMTLDKFDNIWVTGRTWSTNFPTTTNAQKSQLSSFYETFLFKVDKNLKLVYCSLFGPTISDSGTLTLSEAIVSDTEGNIFLSGYSNSGKLPVTANAYQQNKKDSYDGFLAKFDNNAGLIFCTYFGGTLQDYPSNIAVDAYDNIYIQTITASQDLEVKSDNFNQLFLGGLDIYLTKFSNSGQLIWSTYFGGAGKDGEDYNALGKIYGSLTIKNDKLYNFFRTTSSGLYSFPESYNENSTGKTDAYLSKFDLNCNLLYSTYFSGTNDEIAGDFVCDKDGKLVICGWTNSNDLPLKDEIQNINNGKYDAFLTIFFQTLPDDDKPPVIFSQSDSCNVFRIITVTDEDIYDRGIKSIEVVKSENCSIQIIHSSLKRKIIRIKLYDEGTQGGYTIKVLDSSDNIQLIDGVLLPNPSTRISLNPSDTLFISPTPPGAMSCDSLTLTNINEFELLISDIYLHSNIKFSVPSHQFPIIIPPNGKSNLAICFYSEQLVSNKYFDSLEFRSDCYTKGLMLAAETFLEDVYGNSKCDMPILFSFDSNSIKSIIIYPNPVENNLISLYKNNMESPTKLIIYNMLGEIVFENIYNSKPKFNDIQIDVSSFNNGYYFIVLFSGQKYYYEKFAVSR